MRIGIIGAGHAGVEAAKVAAEAGADVTVFSNENTLPYFRPRLVALAFGQAQAAQMSLHPEEWYRERGIKLVYRAVARIVAADKSVSGDGFKERFDRLILACGARPVMPFESSAKDRILPLWDTAHAEALARVAVPDRTLLIVGGGILAIEAALRAVQSGVHVHLVERMGRLMPAQFGTRASRVLLHRILHKHIRVSLGRTVDSIQTGRADGALVARLDNGEELDADGVLVSIGARPDIRLAEQAGLTVNRGIVVDAALQTSSDGVYAAGDVITFSGVTRCSVVEALGQGRVAGANAVASLQGSILQTYRPQTAPLSFKSGDFELYSAGQAGGPGTDEVDLDGISESVFRSLIVRDGVTMGVQMIGTRQGFDEYARKIVVEPVRHDPGRRPVAVQVDFNPSFPGQCAS